MTDKKTTDDGLPIIPKLPEKLVPSHDGAIAQCGECGMRLMPVMGYSCNNPRCPVMPVITCGVNND